MQTIELVLPRPHIGQQKVLSEAGRFNVLAAGRRWGKDTLCEDRLIRPALDGFPVAWFSPTYKNLADVWRLLVDRLHDVTKDKSEQEHRLKLVTNGVIEMWSLEDPDSSRGRAYKRVVVNEAATVPNLAYAWQQVIRPELTDFAGDAWFISTPKGLDAFFDLYRRGQDPRFPEWKSWRRPTVENPHVPPEEVEKARHELPDAVFRQEYLAEFIEGAGGIFRHVTDCATAESQDGAQSGHAYVIGVDWAKLQDFSVFAVMDASLRSLVRIERMQLVDYDLQVGRLQALVHRFRPDTVVVERTGQDALIEQLMRADLKIRPFDTTTQSKKAVVDALSLAFDRQEIKILPDPVLLGELQSYRAEKLPSGQLRYGAPEGQHDDTVMALAFAWSAAAAYPKIEIGPNWRDDYDPGEPRGRGRDPSGFIGR